MAVERFFDFEKEGVIKTKAGGSRVFFIGTRGWSVIEKQLLTVFSTGASVMLKEMGVGYGRGVAKEVMAVEKDPSQVLKVLTELCQAAGWGAAEVKGNATKGQGFEVLISRCAFCASGQFGRDAACHFMAGVCAGAATEAFHAPYKAAEVKCMRKGDPLCVISLTPARA